MPLYISIRQRAVSLPQHAFLVGLCLILQSVNQIAHVKVNVSRDLSYPAVKLFSKYSNQCDNGT